MYLKAALRHGHGWAFFLGKIYPYETLSRRADVPDVFTGHPSEELLFIFQAILHTYVGT
jgi:hypothetical protein